MPWVKHLALLWVLLATAEAAPAKPAAVQRPNILYILADDMGVGDVSSLNPKSAWKTPNIDRLAAQGRVFTDAHSASGVCSPSRYALLTGRYSWRGALKSSVLHGYDRSLIEPNRTTVAAYLKSAGYETAMVGKWHLGVNWVLTGRRPEEVDFSKPFGGGPTTLGFDRFFGISASLDMPPYVYLDGDHSTVVPTGRVTDSPKPKMWRAGPIGSDFKFEEVHPRFIEKAIGFLDTHAREGKGRPFFLYLAMASPHTPIIPTKGFEGKTRTNPYGDFVVQLDASIGELLSALDRLGMARNTLVIFTADNGCSPAANLDELKQLHHDPSAGFRGHKADLFEGGHRVPFVARWPGQIPAGTRCTQTVGQLDLLATCADLLGKVLPETVGEDSVSMLPLLKGGNQPVGGREVLIHHSNNGSFAARQGKWKLLMTPDSGGWSFPQPGKGLTQGLPRYQLYDLEADPCEATNRMSEHPDVVTRLAKALKRAIERGRSTPGTPQPYESKNPWPQIAWISEFTD